MKVALPDTWQKVNVARWRFWSSVVFLTSLSVASFVAIRVADKVLPMHRSLLSASQGNVTGLNQFHPGPAEANGVLVWLVILLPYVIMMCKSKREMAAENSAAAEATQEAQEPVYRIYNPAVPGAVEAWLPEAASSPVNVSEEEDHQKVFTSSAKSLAVLFFLGLLKLGSIGFAFIAIYWKLFSDFILLMDIVLAAQGIEALLNSLFIMRTCKKLVSKTVEEMWEGFKR